MAATPSTLAASRMKAIRKALGLTQQGLSDKLAAVGEPMARGTIAKIESGLREFSLDELMAVAVALGVSPRALLLPLDGLQERVRVAPSVEVDGWELAGYLDGRGLLLEQLKRSEDETLAAMRAFDAHLELPKQIDEAVREHPAVSAVSRLAGDVKYGAFRDRHQTGQNGPRGDQLREPLAEVTQHVEALADRMDQLDREGDR